MYLPSELEPKDTTLYAVVVVRRATGARHIEHIVEDESHALQLAEIVEGFVLEIDKIADYR